MKQLENKIIIVTGGNGLLGKEMIQEIQKKGGIAINFDHEISTNELDNRNELYCDITNRDIVNSCLKKVAEKYGRIEGLVNNAYPRTKDWGNIFEDIKKSSWSENVDMQLNSVFNITQEAVKYMKGQGDTSIVNIASIYGVVGNDFSVYEGTNLTSPAAYSAIKGGIINFSRYLASYFGKQNVRINCVSPGGIFDNQPRSFVNNYEKKVPLGRMGRPEDIAPSVAFLLSEEARYITGHNLIVDGGWTAI